MKNPNFRHRFHLQKQAGKQPSKLSKNH